MNLVSLDISFIMVFSHDKWTAWVHRVHRLKEVQLSDERDKFTWHLTGSGIFSVKSLYVDLMNDQIVFLINYIWRLKVPLKN
jgi:hypothetical protein